MLSPADQSQQKLMAMITLLAGRATDANAKKQISTQAFLRLAQSIGINVTLDSLGDMIAKPPLSNILEPYEPNSSIIRFKGSDTPDTGMSVDQAEQIVNTNAKSALKRRQ